MDFLLSIGEKEALGTHPSTSKLTGGEPLPGTFREQFKALFDNSCINSIQSSEDLSKFLHKFIIKICNDEVAAEV